MNAKTLKNKLNKALESRRSATGELNAVHTLLKELGHARKGILYPMKLMSSGKRRVNINLFKDTPLGEGFAIAISNGVTTDGQAHFLKIVESGDQVLVDQFKSKFKKMPLEIVPIRGRANFQEHWIEFDPVILGGKRKNGKEYTHDDYVEFFYEIDSSQVPQKQKLAFEKQVDRILRSLPYDYTGNNYKGDSELYYLVLGSLRGEGVGLWENREDWHKELEKAMRYDLSSSNKLYKAFSLLDLAAQDTGGIYSNPRAKKNSIQKRKNGCACKLFRKNPPMAFNDLQKYAQHLDSIGKGAIFAGVVPLIYDGKSTLYELDNNGQIAYAYSIPESFQIMNSIPVHLFSMDEGDYEQRNFDGVYELVLREMLSHLQAEQSRRGLRRGMGVKVETPADLPVVEPIKTQEVIDQIEEKEEELPPPEIIAPEPEVEEEEEQKLTDKEQGMVDFVIEGVRKLKEGVDVKISSLNGKIRNKNAKKALDEHYGKDVKVVIQQAKAEYDQIVRSEKRAEKKRIKEIIDYLKSFEQGKIKSISGRKLRISKELDSDVVNVGVGANWELSSIQEVVDFLEPKEDLETKKVIEIAKYLKSFEKGQISKIDRRKIKIPKDLDLDSINKRVGREWGVNSISEAIKVIEQMKTPVAEKPKPKPEKDMTEDEKDKQAGRVADKFDSVDEARKKARELLAKIKPYVSVPQYRATSRMATGALIETLEDVVRNIEATPKAQKTDGKKNPTYFLHYFKGGHDFYVKELYFNSDDGMIYIFGLGGQFHDNIQESLAYGTVELGESILNAGDPPPPQAKDFALLSQGFELDYYFEPMTQEELYKKYTPASPKEELDIEEIDESPIEDDFEEIDEVEDSSGSVDPFADAGEKLAGSKAFQDLMEGLLKGI